MSQCSTSTHGPCFFNMGFILWLVDGMSAFQSQLGALHHRSDTPNLSGISIKKTHSQTVHHGALSRSCVASYTTVQKQIKSLFNTWVLGTWVCVPKSLFSTNRYFWRSCCCTARLSDTILHLNLPSLFACHDPDSGPDQLDRHLDTRVVVHDTLHKYLSITLIMKC